MKNVFSDKEVANKNNKQSFFSSRGSVSNYILLFVVLVSIVVFGYEKLEANMKVEEPNNEAFVYEVEMNLEIDGKPVRLTRRSGCNAITYSKAGGAKFSEISATGYSMSKQLPTGEYVFVGSPSPCRFFKKVEDENGNTKYEIPELMEDYLPKIHIADKAPVPDVVEIYDMPRVFEAPGARVKYISTKVTPMPIGTVLEKKEPDPFEFFFGKGDGPFYFSLMLSDSAMIPELQELINKHTPNATEPIALYTKQWFLDFYHGKKELGNIGVIKRKISEASAKDFITYPLLFDKGTDFHEDTYNMSPSYELSFIKVYYRLPYDALKHKHHELFSKKNLNISFPSGEIYKMKANEANAFTRHFVYDPKIKDLHFIANRYIATKELKGNLKKYNYKVR
ncbi:MAG: hypothetical protein PQ612_06870 [Rickettsiales bacterium]|nr:hypothetical protein [Pseudomonadota bacterium]MDA0966698.1 hypothetical protein [Pseudomonadota bacterium]MDG4543725.1 hypothetical protein [Rickettsiales bacterium]MDG4545872.1 hypothetical protein [Rickettsiales bacterium]MDG4547353.1 hypothetical protein [Rickettsiales bacterium]